MRDLDEKIVTAWLEASNDLCVAVVAPYRVETSWPMVLLCEAFVPDFGSPMGAVVISSRSRGLVRSILRESGRWHSDLGDGYARYNRKLFIETLNDWGWFGQDHLKPEWYTGEPWT
jgi:hypothetical protein